MLAQRAGCFPFPQNDRVSSLAQICSLLRGGIAERGGVRVGHRIIEINGQSVVAVPHERIVNLLATSIGEVKSKRYIYTPDAFIDVCLSRSR